MNTNLKYSISSNGFICWIENGYCMKIRFDKLKGNKKNDQDYDESTQARRFN